jgi:hypothetical protein
MKIYSAVVSQVVPVRFADLAQAAETLPGLEFSEDRARLQIHGSAGAGLAGAVRYRATLRTTAALLPPMKVEVVVSPWSAGRSEVAIQPLTRLGQLDSLRSHRFFKAARAVLPAVIDRLSTDVPVAAPAEVRLAA